MELFKITQQQRDKLIELGYNANDNTTVVEALLWMRHPKHITPPYYVRCYWSAYCVAEVFSYLTIEEQRTNTGNRWYSEPSSSWEQVESFALDYILSKTDDSEW